MIVITVFFMSPDAQKKLNKNLGRAVVNSDMAKVEELVREGADPNALFGGFFDRGVSLLNFAIFAEERDRAAMVRRLLKNGADPNAADATGKLPLVYAAENGRYDAVRALIDAGAQIDKKSKDGMTAYMTAAKHGRAGIASYLAAYDADVLKKSTAGLTAFQYAIRASFDSVSVSGGTVYARETQEWAQLLEQLSSAEHTQKQRMAEQKRKNGVGMYDVVTFEQPAGDNRVMQQIFNFVTRERVSLVLESPGNRVEAVTIEPFSALGGSQSLKDAFAKYKSHGGTLREEDVIENVLTAKSSTAAPPAPIRKGGPDAG